MTSSVFLNLPSGVTDVKGLFSNFHKRTNFVRVVTKFFRNHLVLCQRRHLKLVPSLTGRLEGTTVQFCSTQPF